jgi:thymidylate synthase
MSGSSNIKDLHPSVHSWWKDWADENGEVKFNYSAQFRHQYGCDRDSAFTKWATNELIHCDQIEEFISDLKKHPNSRRIILSTWNSAEMRQSYCPITNCHNTITQAFVTDGKLKLVTYQRSVDMVCGLPHNWIQEWAFQLWLCKQTGLEMGSLVWIGGDCHVYEEHFPLAIRIMAQEIKESPQLIYTPTSDAFKADDFSLDTEYVPSLTERAVMVV